MKRLRIDAIIMLGMAAFMLAGWIYALVTKADAMRNGNLGLVWFVLIVCVATSGLLALFRA